MATEVKKVRIFVASPSDVQSERDQLFKVITELNLTISALAPEKAIILELVRWETHVHPGLGDDAQKVVNEQVGDYDVFVGILWKRMGTPTTTAQSGTEEEFQLAYRLWNENKTLPVLFYFCQQAFSPPRTEDEIKQLGRVVAFRNELSAKGLVWEYEDHNGFADVVRPHLLLVIRDIFFSKAARLETAQRAGELTGRAGVSAIRVQILGLANEYEEIRRSMQSGNDRTRRMELVASKMRSLALPAYPLFGELVISESAGQRLAAVSILEAIPNADHLAWLSERIAVEKPFIGYHAAIALLNAARNLRASENHAAVEKAIRQALQNLDRKVWKDPEQVAVLKNAEQELKWVEKVKR